MKFTGSMLEKAMGRCKWPYTRKTKWLKQCHLGSLSWLVSYVLRLCSRQFSLCSIKDDQLQLQSAIPKEEKPSLFEFI